MTDDVVHVMKKYRNICNYIHLPVQSGSSKILKKMNRGYTKEWYLKRIHSIREIIPDCAISTDIITGFCDESEEDFKTFMIQEIDENDQVTYTYTDEFTYYAYAKETFAQFWKGSSSKDADIFLI